MTKTEILEERSPVAAETSGVTPDPYAGGTTALTSMSRAVIEITNRRYQSDPFWGGPKGVEYGLLVGALPVQQPVLFPDRGSTYFVGQFHLPAGAYLTIHGEYGHLRYFSYTVASQLPGGQLGNGPFLRDDMIDPEPGSYNPFRPGSDRDGKKDRKYVLKIVQGNPPKENIPPNTLYTCSDSESDPIYLSFRNYIPDAGYDGTGNVELHGDGYGLPKVYLHLLHEPIPLEGEAMAKAVRASKKQVAKGYPVTGWLDLVKGSIDPVNAPALPTPVFQRYWNIDYNGVGGFILDPAQRVQQYPAVNAGGLAPNPDTVYLTTSFSLYYGQVVVIRGKMPTHPKTRHHQKTWPADAQVRYWSATTGGSVASGAGWDSVFDEDVALDKDGYFTLVMSWKEDRPKNAIKENGVTWIDFGAGEGHYVGARSWVNTVYFRYMDSNPSWKQSPVNIPPPTPQQPIPQDAEVMQEYFPRAVYMSKADFEAFFPSGFLRQIAVGS
ncbi:MAG: hypothetical protein HC897_09620 [Thermoanaerobaculia bacterium]|nr:hypothetical protein [Thermoanaerobaculia bacterium]